MAHRAPLTLPRSHRPPRILLGVAVAALLAVVALMFWPAPSPGRPRASAEDPPAASADYRTLVGDWRRWDGDYTLRLRRVDPSGQMQAEYLNPRPIHVFQARAAADKGVLRLFVELRDVGYPGATYNLAYDTSRDSLVGVYYQPAAQQAYQVGFTRASPHGFTGVCPMLQSPLPLPALSAEGRRFHVMAKPVGAACNLACTYCYYLGKDHLGDGGIGRGRMTDAVLETYIRDYIQSQAGPEIIFTWQGGEPTLMGLEFFRKAISLQHQFAQPGKRIENDLQTNSTLLDDEWCRFLKANRFWVGLSIDGPRDLHDAFRHDKHGQPTFDQVVRAYERLRATACPSTRSRLSTAAMPPGRWTSTGSWCAISRATAPVPALRGAQVLPGHRAAVLAPRGPAHRWVLCSPARHAGFGGVRPLPVQDLRRMDPPRCR